jgi:16S rRNA processing protein RimM
MKTDAKDLVVMGRIVAPYGVFGWLKIIPDTEIFDTLLDYKTWWIGKDSEWRELKLESAKVHNDVLLVKLQGIEERDGAFTCKGKLVAVPRASLPELSNEEYYWSDLIGLDVKNQLDVDFGKITDVLETGANDVIVVSGQDATGKRERLIPFTAQTILEVSLEKQTMLVDWDEDF